MVDERLLKQRKQVKAKKPYFIKQDSIKKVEVKQRWRRPKGLHSKQRLGRRGHMRCVSPGYGSPKAVYGLHPSGLKTVLVYSIDDIENIDAKTQGAIIAKGVGLRKRIGLVNKAKEKGITILNIKDVNKYLEEIDKNLKERKDNKKSKEEEKTKNKKDAAEKSKEKKEKKLDEKLSEEELKEEEKKEKDKLLIKKEA